jgi:hypothetical protein
MQTIRWTAFGLSNSMTRTIVHFLPCGGDTTAPYPANCTLQVFGLGNGGTKRVLDQVVLEGARIGQPDGVRLDQAFAELHEGCEGFFGLTIDLSTIQPRIDLSTSSCIIEFWSRANSVRFRPQPVSVSGGSNLAEPGFSLARAAERRRAAGILALKDSFNSCSLLAVNDSDAMRKTAFQMEPGIPDEAGAQEVGPRSTLEIPLDNGLFSKVPSSEASWGFVQAAGIGSDSTDDGLALFALYRDCSTRALVSVCAL